MLVGTVHDITERKKAEEEKQQTHYLLNERIKELTTVYRASQIFQSEIKPVDDVLQELVSILPAGWQYPPVTEARIVLDEKEYKTKGFGFCADSQSAVFVTGKGKNGLIEVAYTEKKPIEVEGPFLEEERKLIDMLSTMLGAYLNRKEATEQLLKEKELSDSVINSLPGLFYLQSITGEFLRWNKQAEIVTGYSAAEMGKLHPLDFFDEEDKKIVLRKSVEAYTNGTADTEAALVTKDGRKIPYYFIASLIEYEGQPCIIGAGLDIAERKKAEDQLLKEKQLSESIINSLPGIFYLFDNTGKYLRWNKNHETVPGYTTEEMQAMHPLNFFDDDEKELIKERIGKVFTEGYSDAEANFMGKNGQKTPYYFNGIAIEYEGKPCLMGVAFDITERKRVENELLESEVRFREVLENSISASYKRSLLTNTYEYLSPVFKKIAGYTQDEMNNMPIEMVIGMMHPDDIEVVKDGIIKAITELNGLANTLEYRFKHKTDDEYRWLRDEFVVMQDAKGQPVSLIGSVSDITESKKAAEQLLREKELSESIINTLPGIFYIFDMEGKQLLWNKNYETVTGYSYEELSNIKAGALIAAEEQEYIAQKIMKGFTEGSTDAEATLVCKDGRGIPYYFTGIAVTYHDKPCLLGVGIDIAERKKFEQELRQAEIKFRTLVEKSQVGVYIVREGKFIYVNPRFAEIFGYRADELIGINPVETIISEEYRSLARENVRARMDGEVESVHYEVAGKKKDGTINRVEFYGSRTIYEGQPTIIGTMIDITERKMAEEALQKSEANLHTVFDTTDTIYVLLDNNFQVKSFNQRAIDFVKNELGHQLKLDTNLIKYFPIGRQPELYTKMKQVLARENISYEANYPQKDGSFKWYNVRMFPITDNEKRILGMMVATSDVTEKKLLEQEITTKKVQEQKKMTRLVLNVQEKERNKIGQELHDNVNQILVGSKMYLGLLDKRSAGKEELVSRSMTLIDNAINEIRILTREQVTPQKKIDLKDLIQSLLDNLNEHNSLKTRFVFNTGTFAITDDLKLNIYRIIQEGINNILKHAEAKNVAIMVNAHIDGLHITISDDGKGFDGLTTKNKGVGITNIVNRVESYNGTVSINGQKGSGCTVEISIPV